MEPEIALLLQKITELIVVIKQEQGLPESYQQKVEDNNKKSGHSDKEPAKLTNNEKKRHAQIFEILKKVLNLGPIAAQTQTTGVKTDKFHNTELKERIIPVRIVSLAPEVLSSINLGAKAVSGSKDDKKKSLLSSIGIGNVLTIGAFGIGIAQLVKSFTKDGVIDWKGVVDTANKFVKFYGIFLSAIGKGTFLTNFAAIVAIITNDLIPSITELAQVDSNNLSIATLNIIGLAGALMIIAGGSGGGVLPGTQIKVGAIKAFNKGIAIAALGGLAYILKNYIVPSMQMLQEVKWDKAAAASGVAVGAILGLSGIAAAIGSIAGLGLNITLGGAVIFGITELLRNAGDALQPFSQYDWEKIGKSVAIAEVAIAGLGTIAGIIGTFVVPFAIGEAAIAGLVKILGWMAGEMANFAALGSNDHLEKAAKQIGLLIGSLGKLDVAAANALSGTITSITKSLTKITDFFTKTPNAEKTFKVFTALVKDLSLSLAEGVKYLRPEAATSFGYAIKSVGSSLEHINEFFETSVFGNNEGRKNALLFAQTIESFGKSLNIATQSLSVDRVNAFGSSMLAFGKVLESIKATFHEGLIQSFLIAIGAQTTSEADFDMGRLMLEKLGMSLRTATDGLQPSKLQAFSGALNSLTKLYVLKDLKDLDASSLIELFKGLSQNPISVDFNVKDKNTEVIVNLHKEEIKLQGMQLIELKEHTKLLALLSNKNSGNSNAYNFFDKNKRSAPSGENNILTRDDYRMGF